MTAQKAAMTRNRVWIAWGDSGAGTRWVDLEGVEGVEASAVGDTGSPDLAVMTRACFVLWMTTARARGREEGGLEWWRGDVVLEVGEGGQGGT